ncbi:MAG TPA: PAS domain-containing sensor histidine kinase [Methanocella sp.]|nr:PAS domain-containing sensor histidine kinase [Methanocella sp.]
MEDVKPKDGKDIDQLQPDDEKYRFLLENSQDILWTVDLTGTWQFITRNVEKIVDIKVEDIIGKKAWDFVTPETRTVLMDRLQRRLKGEEVPPYEVIVIDKYGMRIPFEVNTSPIYNKEGKIIGIQGISREVTERKRSENTLRKSEEKYRNLVENLYDWVWEIDRNTVFIYSSPRVVVLLAYSPQEIVGMSLYDLMKPAETNRIKELLEGVVSQQRPFYAVECTLISRGGENIAVEMNGTPIFGDDNTLRGYRGICRDISDRKKAENALQTAYSELEKRVEDRTEELQESKAEAELYIDLMSHDINNLNTVAMGDIEIAQQMMAGNKDAVNRLDRSLEMLKSGSQLIDNVRKIQQTEIGELQSEKIDICKIMEDVEKKYSSREGKIVKINVSRPENGPCTMTANKLLWDVFANLMDNSIKHAIQETPVVIDITISKIREGPKDFFKVTVEDNGPGIPDNMKDRLFTRLHRGKTRATGRGLGLYLVKTLVESFEGRIWVEDRIKGKPFKGAKFIVMLPAG